ncbi:ABC transporter ATP-binding protein [Pectobacterium brasiliense]|uniref:ABC transporter ATP-binding protein n=1 Tax=Pectobacterium brasiliense TaxID=180957 RepID=UPI0019696A95|nr:ATP-binding cassette domain-containing protein [Pectobacterium brasiliense]MBN3230973.1 ATP-binding cassette domain-containing protein [Pectobacterium brasiliense]
MKDNENIIYVENVSRFYQLKKRNSGFFGSLFSREAQQIQAVNDVSFTIKKGEIVGFIGPNGAGKSTTLKMLSGILLPSAGKILVLGNDPFKYRRINNFNIGTIFGQRTQLWWDLPVCDTMKLIKRIYKVSDHDFLRNIDLFNQHLSIKDIWNQPVRQLSLGQRMKAELAASILYNPKILFLDEPTIGLDLLAKKQIRKFISTLNYIYGTTVIITSHDMGDIEELCGRIIIIDHGAVMYDGALTGITEKYSDELSVSFLFDKPFLHEERITNCCSIKHTDDRNNYIFTFKKSQKDINDLIMEISQVIDDKYVKIKNIKINESPVEDIVRKLYKSKSY